MKFLWFQDDASIMNKSNSKNKKRKGKNFKKVGNKN